MFPMCSCCGCEIRDQKSEHNCIQSLRQEHQRVKCQMQHQMRKITNKMDELRNGADAAAHIITRREFLKRMLMFSHDPRP